MKSFRTTSKLIAYSIVVIFLNSCEEPFPNQSLTTKKIKTVILNSALYRSIDFEYVNDNLDKMTEPGRSRTFYYDDDDNNNLTSVLSGAVWSTFAYDSINRVKSYQIGSKSVNFTYEESRITLSYPGLPRIHPDEYVYMQNGNLILWENAYGFLEIKAEYEYDNKPNSFGSIPYEFIYDVFPDYPITNLNNVVKLTIFETIDNVTKVSDIYEYQYVYSDDGYPISCLGTHTVTNEWYNGLDPVIYTSTYDYGYE